MITEKNVVRMLRRHEEEALLYVVDTYSGLIKSVIHKYLYKYPEEEKECMNDVFLGIWKNAADFDAKKGSFKNWICVIARYKAINMLQRKLRCMEDAVLEDMEAGLTEAFAADSAESQMLEQIVSEELEKMLSALSPQDRDILMKCYVEELEIGEIAKQYQLKPASVYSRISRAKDKMRRMKKEKKCMDHPTAG